MARYDYSAPLEGTERFVERPDGTSLRTISVGSCDSTVVKSGILLSMLRFGPIAHAFTKSLAGDGFEPEMVPACMAEFRANDHSKLVPILQALVDEDRFDRLGELDIPTSIVVGSKDKTTPPFHTADLHAGIAGSKLVTIPGMGTRSTGKFPTR